MTDDEKRPGEMIIITPERGADDLGIMLFGQFLGLRRAPGMTVDEALADIERTDPDTAARVRKVGKTLHGILTSSITQATNERDEWKARATQAESDLAATRAELDDVSADARTALAQAESDLAAARERVKEMRAAMLKMRRSLIDDNAEVLHRYEGQCPDPSQPESSDPECAGCDLVKIIDAALTPETP